MEDFRTYRRKLPHWELRGSVYFVTFTCVSGLALPDASKDIVLSSLRFHAGTKYRLFACVVMATHAHSLLQPLELPTPPPRGPPPPSLANSGVCYSLAQITHSIKSYSANRIRKCLGYTGKVWLDESYDRIVRDDKEFGEKFDYIAANPVKAGLVEKPEDYRWLFLDDAA